MGGRGEGRGEVEGDWGLVFWSRYVGIHIGLTLYVSVCTGMPLSLHHISILWNQELNSLKTSKNLLLRLP